MPAALTFLDICVIRTCLLQSEHAISDVLRVFLFVHTKDNFTLEQATRTKSTGIAYSFFNFGARWGGWSLPRLGLFTPKERLSTH